MGIFVKNSVGKTTEMLLEYPNSQVMRQYFGAFFFNLIGFLHKKYSPVTGLSRYVTLCHAAMSRCVTWCPHYVPGLSPICPGDMFYDVPILLPVTEQVMLS